MDIQKFLKPTIFKIALSVIIGFFYLYLAKEEVCGAGFVFTFCYKAYGFPFKYLATGNVEMAYSILKNFFLNSLFYRHGGFLFNYASFVFDAGLIYLASCGISFLANDFKPNK